CD
ncbi:glutathione S-transferase, N-terminal domain protein, partial [Vibrio parahaemolyticus VPTS-2010_2]